MREALRVARQKDCPPGVDLEDGLMAMRELEKMVRESFRWLKRVERSPAKATYDKKRAPREGGPRQRTHWALGQPDPEARSGDDRRIRKAPGGSKAEPCEL